MLAAQMVSCHSQAMEFLRLALLNRSSAEHAKILSTIANKFLRTYVLQMEALSKYRRKGEQTVRVEHVTVNAGGQAIVGQVQTGRGVTKKMANEPHVHFDLRKAKRCGARAKGTGSYPYLSHRPCG
jgi:hypothetical protein